MCMNCGCARPDDDGPDHDAIPGGTAEAATLRSRNSLAPFHFLNGPAAVTRDAQDALTPNYWVRKTHASNHSQED